MLIAVITDTHLNNKNGQFIEGIFDQTFDICAELGITKLKHAGDWYTARSGQTISTLMTTRNILAESQKRGIELSVIAGNHDKDNQKALESFVSVFSGFTGCNVIEDYETFTYGNCKIHMVPYFPEEEEIYPQIIKQLNTKDADINILITHIAVNGVKNNDGSEVTSGLEKNLFSKFDKVLVGHYHNASKVGKNIFYIGSAYQANFGEDDAKGITIINTETGEIDFCQLDFPKFITREVDASEAIANSKDILDVREGDFLRVKIKGTEAEVNSVHKDLFDSPGVKVEKVLDEIQVEEEEIELVSFDKESLQSEWKEFTKSKGIKKKNQEKGLEYLKKM